MALRIVRLGTPRVAGEGLRIGTVRRPPRGVPKAEFARRDYYDAWLPMLSPSDELVSFALHVKHDATGDAQWRQFVRRFRAEMAAPDARHLLETLAALSHHADFSVGCYCEDESRCHRSVLRQLFTELDARLVDAP